MHELRPQVRLKLHTLVSVDGGWNTEACNPASDESMLNGGCGDVK